MKFLAILIFSFPLIAFATPSHLSCTDNIEIDLQYNWVRSSYIGVKNSTTTAWYHWTGKEALVSGSDIRLHTQSLDPVSLTHTALASLDGQINFNKFLFNAEKNWWNTSPVEFYSYLYIQN
jgi:hypothetical protein